MRQEQAPQNNNEPFLPFDHSYEEERMQLAKEHNVPIALVDKRSDGNWYVRGVVQYPKGTFDGRTTDSESNPWKKPN